jgi:hypothetical protein
VASDPRQDTIANGQRLNLADFWTQHYDRFRTSRERVELCGLLRRSQDPPAVPPDMDNADAFRITTPFGPKIVMDVLQTFTAKVPDIKRNAGPGPMAERLAEKVEHFLGRSGKAGALGELKAGGEPIWDNLVAHATDGEFGLLVVPRPAHWSGLLQFTEPDPDDPQGPGRIHPYFQRDAEGRDAADELYADPHDPEIDFEIDASKSSNAYAKYARDAKARNLPIVVTVMAPSICLPIGLDPGSGKVDAMLIRTLRTMRSLDRDGFHWTMLGPGDAPNDQRGWTTSSFLRGLDQRLMLYELWVPGGVYYQIGNLPLEGKPAVGYPTTMNTYDKDGTLVTANEAFVNLEAEYGLCDVPGGYFYGCHWPQERDPDQKGYPLLWTYRGLIRGLNNVVSADVAHTYNVGFGGFFVDPTGIDPKYWTENGRPLSVKIKRGQVSYVAGKPVPAVHPGVNKDNQQFITFALGQLGASMPPSPAGGPAGMGPVAMGVQQVASEYAQAQILNGAVLAYRRTAELILCIVAALSETLGEPIPVYTRIDKDGNRHDLLDLSAKDLGNDYTVDVVFPTKKGSNVPLAQAMFQWMAGGALSHYTWLSEGWGEEFPEEEIDRINVETALKSPQGQKLVWDLAAKMQGDKDMARIAKLQQDGSLTTGGMPTALLPPRPSGAIARDGTPGPGTAGVQVGNSAISSLGGQMNATMGTGLQAQIMSQTGQGATLSPNGTAGGG